MFKKTVVAIAAFTSSYPRLGQQQTEKEIPMSSSRKPMVHGGRMHEFPGARDVLPYEAGMWKFMKRWELEMKGEWDDLEQFKGLPKPKKQFGNEAASIVWPYATLLENVIRVHPFTKSIYCYYGQHSSTEHGLKCNQLATKFARECMIPITFHNPQCYVESEMLLEYNDTPWLVINCLDGRKKLLPIKVPSQKQLDECGHKDAKLFLLDQVVSLCDEMGNSVQDKQGLLRSFHERPNQHHYLRIDYQWMGKTPEERQQHLVQWYNEDKMNPAVLDKKIYRRHSVMNDWLQARSDKPIHWRMVSWKVKKENNHMRSKMTEARGLKNFGTETRHSSGLFSSSAAPYNLEGQHSHN